MKVNKKSIMGPVISVFVLVLVVSILAGLTFLFVANLKAQSVGSSYSHVTVINESVTFDDQNTIQSLAASTKLEVVCGAITSVTNQTTTGAVLTVANVTRTGCTVLNASALNAAGWGGNGTVYVSYGYDYVGAGVSAYNAVNGTEAAGYTLVGYLPLIFLAIIFGAILTLVLKVILPYINLGQNMGGF
jgi:hypothetical protein